MPDDLTVTIPVGGMSCQHCVSSVTAALTALPGVTGVQADLTKGEVRVTGKALDIPALRTAIEEIGFDAGEPLNA